MHTEARIHHFRFSARMTLQIAEARLLEHVCGLSHDGVQTTMSLTSMTMLSLQLHSVPPTLSVLIIGRLAPGAAHVPERPFA